MTGGNFKRKQRGGSAINVGSTKYTETGPKLGFKILQKFYTPTERFVNVETEG